VTVSDLLAHGAWLHRLAHHLVHASGAADDLVQDTWVAALRARPDRAQPLRPWLAEVLRNLVRNRARGASRWAAQAPKVAAAGDVPLPTPRIS
jgi:DNA-directed RNA polymerase specialized sigma24 family protein